MSGAVLRRRRTTACSYHRSSCRSQSYGAVCSSSAQSMRSSVPRHMLRISIRANLQCSCLRIVARHVIPAHAISPGAASVPRSSCSCKNITRAIRARPGSLLLIWRPSTVHKAADRKLPGWSVLRPGQIGPRSVRPCRCHPLDRIEIGEELMCLAGRQSRFAVRFDLEHRCSGVSKTEHRS